ncbi:MAG TPA: hypothetical protein VE986_11335 [Hyphomicrobiales bacterium]|nr:hypothetical protein [Hyphomicrobiales bacterium]
MHLRLLFAAALALAAVASFSESRAADGYYPGYRSQPRARYYHSRIPRRHPRFYSYRETFIGRLFSRPERPFIGNEAYNYPGFYNNQSFWERVQTQGNYPVQY